MWLPLPLPFWYQTKQVELRGVLVRRALKILTIFAGLESSTLPNFLRPFPPSPLTTVCGIQMPVMWQTLCCCLALVASIVLNIVCWYLAHRASMELFRVRAPFYFSGTADSVCLPWGNKRTLPPLPSLWIACVNAWACFVLGKQREIIGVNKVPFAFGLICFMPKVLSRHMVHSSRSRATPRFSFWRRDKQTDKQTETM